MLAIGFGLPSSSFVAGRTTRLADIDETATVEHVGDRCNVLVLLFLIEAGL